MSNNEHLPRNVVEHDGNYLWVPTQDARRLDWCNVPLGKDRSAAVAEATKLNERSEMEVSGSEWARD